MIRSFHELQASEDGQALALGAVVLLVIALGLLGTAQLAGRIHDRIALQDGADAAAYSLAVEEARAFNHYAYANRAQIAQYVTVLQLLSVDAMLLGVLAGLGTFAAVAKTVGELCSGAKAAVCVAIPVIGKAMALVSRVMQVVERIARAAGQAILAFDRFVGQVAVPLLVAANLLLFAQQQAMRARVAALLAGNRGLEVAQVAAPGARENALVRALNLRRFEQAHLRESMELAGQRDPAGAGLEEGAAGRRNWARRGMAELVHASRWDASVYDRSFPGPLAGTLEGVPGIEAVESLLGLLPVARLRGHTRLLSEDHPTPARSAAIYERMEKPGYGTARYPTGNAVGANFYLAAAGLDGDPGGLGTALGIGQRHVASVTSTSPADGGGWVCSWDVASPYRSFGIPETLEIFVPRFSCDLARGAHPWWGITPYMAFDATGPGCDDFATEFCQPDVWMALEDEATGARAIARALAYYHRPGNWQEPPNFFNPFWRARLAPVEPGLARLGAAGAALRAWIGAGVGP